MIDAETAAYLDDYRARALAAFPLSRVTRDFHDEMLNVLPPAYRRGIPGFFVSEALSEGIYAQFIDHQGRCYGAYVDVRDEPNTATGPITLAKLDAWRAKPANASATQPLAWYPNF